MLVAHHLEYAALRYERGDIPVYTGSYKDVPIAVISVGFEPVSATEYFGEAKQLGVSEVLYIGECLSSSRRHALRTVILADGGNAALLERAARAAAKHSIAVTVSPVPAELFSSPISPISHTSTESHEPPESPCNFTPSAAEAGSPVPDSEHGLTVTSNGFLAGFYTFAEENGISALSILTVSENIVTGEKMEEHERRSRLYPAARLVFETAAFDRPTI